MQSLDKSYRLKHSSFIVIAVTYYSETETFLVVVANMTISLVGTESNPSFIFHDFLSFAVQRTIVPMQERLPCPT